MSLKFTIRVSINKFHFIRDTSIVEQNREVQKIVVASVMCRYHITKGLAAFSGLLECESLIGSLPLNHKDFISLKSLVIRPSKAENKDYIMFCINYLCAPQPQNIDQPDWKLRQEKSAIMIIFSGLERNLQKGKQNHLWSKPSS